VVEWHVAQGLAVPDGIARRNAFGTYGTPTLWADARDFVAGGTFAYENYLGLIENHLAVPAPFTMDAEAEIGISNVVVRVSLDPPPAARKQFVIRAILFEDMVTYCCDTTGGNEFHHIGRAMTRVDHVTELWERAVLTLPIEPGWDRDQLRVVAFAEDAEGHVVTASGEATLVTARSVSWGRVKALYR